MKENWWQLLAWTDYRLAVLFTVLLPLVLLVWALVEKKDAVGRLMIIYWRVASLLMIAVYLMIPGWPIGFISGMSARILIPISLWFWVDLNEEIRDLSHSALKTLLTSWRWAMTVYCSLGVIANFHFGSCALSPETMATAACKVWLEAPLTFKGIFHPDSTPGFLGFLGIVGLVFYGLYFGYFIVVRLGKQGRSALEQ